MKKSIFAIAIFALTSCSIFSSLTSNTIITPNNAFKLGDNKHGSFSVRLKNVSINDLTIYEAPINGGKHSYVNVKPMQTVHVSVDDDTALIIENKSADTASVYLRVRGDIGLSMGYEK